MEAGRRNKSLPMHWVGVFSGMLKTGIIGGSMLKNGVGKIKSDFRTAVRSCCKKLKESPGDSADAKVHSFHPELLLDTTCSPEHCWVQLKGSWALLAWSDNSWQLWVPRNTASFNCQVTLWTPRPSDYCLEDSPQYIPKFVYSSSVNLSSTYTNINICVYIKKMY